MSYYFLGVTVPSNTVNPSKGVRTTFDVLLQSKQRSGIYLDGFFGTAPSKYRFHLGIEYVNDKNPSLLAYVLNYDVAEQFLAPVETYLHDYYIPVGRHSFSFEWVSDTLWDMKLDNIPIFRYDTGFQQMDRPPLIVGEVIGTKMPPLKTVDFYPAIEFLSISGKYYVGIGYGDGIWKEAPTGHVGINGQPSKGSKWGLEGQIQNPLLRKNEVRMGSSIIMSSVAFWLWEM